MSRSSSRRPAIECDRGAVVRRRARGRASAPVISATLLAARLQIALELLLDGRVGEPGDVRGVDPMLVVGQPAEQQRKPGAHPRASSKYLDLRLCGIEG